jgi:hypothetical protein
MPHRPGAGTEEDRIRSIVQESVDGDVDLEDYIDSLDLADSPDCGTHSGKTIDPQGKLCRS